MVWLNRRTFCGQAGVAGAAVLLSDVTRVAAEPVRADEKSPKQTEQFCAFTESFQGWPIPEVCRRFREIGLDGLDLTVRPGGHIEPAEAAKLLPDAARAARDHGVRLMMLSTAIVDDSALSEQVIAQAAEAGVDRIKLGYFRYTTFGKLREELDDARRRLQAIAKLAAKHRVLPCVHIHSGDTIPGNGPLAWLLLRDFDPSEVGAYADPMHMTIEGGNDGWRQGLDLLAPWIALSSLKNALWERQGRDDSGQERWGTKKCPLADGVAPIPAYLRHLRHIGYRGIFTLHSEYCDRNSWKLLSADECLEQTKQDLIYTRSVLQRVTSPSE